MLELLPRFEDLRPLLPGAGSAFVLMLLAGWFSKSAKRKNWSKIAALAVPLAVFITWWKIYGEFPWPPERSTERALWLTLCGLAFVFLPNRIRERRSLALMVSLLLVGTSVYYLLSPLIETESEFRIESSKVFLIISVVVGSQWIWMGLSRRQNSALLSFAFGLVCVTISQICVFFGVASIAQILGAGGMAFLFLAPIALFFDIRSTIETAGISGVLMVAFFGLDAYFFGDAPPPLRPLIVLTLSPVLVLAEPMLAGLKLRAWLRRGLIVLALLGVAAWAIKESYDGRPIEVDDPYSDIYDFGK